MEPVFFFIFSHALGSIAFAEQVAAVSAPLNIHKYNNRTWKPEPVVFIVV